MQTTLIPGPVGSIEAAISLPEARDPTRFAIICHPHPLFGGTMNNKVITTVAKAYDESGIASVRFNFRGVGASAGSHDHGMGETDDALAILRWIHQQYAPAKIDAVGFSFGAYVAYRLASRTPLHQLISIAPAVTNYEFARDELPTCPWSILVPEADEVVDPLAVLSWVANLPVPVNLYRFPETSHFFHGKLIELRQQLRQIISK